MESKALGPEISSLQGHVRTLSRRPAGRQPEILSDVAGWGVRNQRRGLVAYTFLMSVRTRSMYLPVATSMRTISPGRMNWGTITSRPFSRVAAL